MKTLFFFISIFTCIEAFASPPVTLNLNGTWDFEQTISAFPPSLFTRKIPVPGLIHLAVPGIDEYDKFFKRPEKSVLKITSSTIDIDYTPKYNWYRKSVFISNDLKELEAVLTIKKSQYVTQIYINGIDYGSFIECNTPIDATITRALKFGQNNEILIKVGDRYRLPDQAAGGTDQEKEHYLPGIWDDVTLSFTDKIKVNRLLALPFLKNKKVIVKAQMWNLNPPQWRNSSERQDTVLWEIKIVEKKSQKQVAISAGKFFAKRGALTEVDTEIPIDFPHAWSPDDPFLYSVEITTFYKGQISDIVIKNFGMRDFERRGKFFYLNGEKTFLRGSNITLQRFFEDPDCNNLAWDKDWVKKLLIDIPKSLSWNAMRICVGIVPDFWYDLADEYGLLFQNEWLYWQTHGWENQIRKEYTDWVWSDGSHPSIAIWDGINENWDDYIGNKLIPELKVVDPTRIWDAGYMTPLQMNNDEMDEPHTYQGFRITDELKKNPYPLGNLNYKPVKISKIEEAGVPQLVNEYGWIWLWRNGTPSKLTIPVYNYYLSENSTVTERRNFQAYWLELETEWLRSNRSIAGVLAFTLLTNNYGYTGDWFTGNIKDLTPSPALQWFKESFAPANVFINLTDERYAKNQPVHKPGEQLNFSLLGVNDLNIKKQGEVEIRFLNHEGKEVFKDKIKITLPAADRIKIPYSFKLPDVADGYLLQTSFTTEGSPGKRLSRRFIKVGTKESYTFYESEMPVWSPLKL
jgi:beta-galactosidase